MRNFQSKTQQYVLVFNWMSYYYVWLALNSDLWSLKIQNCHQSVEDNRSRGAFITENKALAELSYRIIVDQLEAINTSSFNLHSHNKLIQHKVTMTS